MICYFLKYSSLAALMLFIVFQSNIKLEFIITWILKQAYLLKEIHLSGNRSLGAVGFINDKQSNKAK